MNNNNAVLVPSQLEALSASQQPEFAAEYPQSDFLSSVWQCLMRHRLQAIAIILTGTFLVIAGVLVVEPIYSATSMVMIDSRRAQVLNVDMAHPELPLDLDVVSNEVQVLTSRDLVAGVVQKLGLEDDPEFNPNKVGPFRAFALSALEALQPWFPNQVIGAARSVVERRMLHGRQYTDAVIDAVERHLTVYPVGRSRAIMVTFTSIRPALAEQFANTLAQSYIDHQAEMKEQVTEDANRRITDKLAGLRESAADAANRVEEFRVRSGLVDGRDTTLVRQQISEVSSQLIAAESERIASAARLSEVERAGGRRGGDGNAEVLKSALIQQLRIQQSQIAREALPSQVTLGERNPRAEVARAQIADIQRRIDAEVQKVVAAVRGEYQAAVDRESGLRAGLENLKAEMAKVRASEVNLNQLAQNANASREVYESFLKRAKETDAGSTIQSPDAYVISHAASATSPVFPNAKLAIPVGIVMSVALALIVILILEARDRGFHSQSDVWRMLGLASLGMIPDMRRNRVPAPLSLIGTAFTELYMRISMAREHKCLLITSALPREGKTSITLTLARMAALNGKKTLLIDADMRHSNRGLLRPMLTNSTGLSELLTSEVRLDEAVFQDKLVRGVSVLSCGAPVDNPSVLICSAAMRNLLNQARRYYDLVIIDSPPLLVGPEAWMLALFADTTLLFVRWARTPCKTVIAAYQKLLSSGAKVSGVVLTMVNVKRIARYSAADAVPYSKEMRGYYAQDTL
jgi:polysaccharide biosynthesis transport protein